MVMGGVGSSVGLSVKYLNLLCCRMVDLNNCLIFWFKMSEDLNNCLKNFFCK